MLPSRSTGPEPAMMSTTGSGPRVLAGYISVPAIVPVGVSRSWGCSSARVGISDVGKDVQATRTTDWSMSLGFEDPPTG